MSLRDHLRGRAPRGAHGSAPSTAKIAALILLLVGVVGLFAALQLKAKREHVPTDPITLCPTDRPPSEVVVLLLDMSDEFSEPQRLKVENEIDALLDTMTRFGLIEPYAVDRVERRVTTPVVQLCNPGTGADLSQIYQNPELARKKWDGFAQQLKAELERLMAVPESSSSAIFEAVQATALRTFNRHGHAKVPKRLVIVSDLLQNVPGKLNMYRGIPAFHEFKRSGYYSDVRADLSRVEVTLLYLVRSPTLQKWPDHHRFWEQYFADQGAAVDRLEPVHGAR